MTNHDREERTLDLPDNTTLPFFAYGIFKPGQLAYSKIKNLVDNHSDDVEINYEMRIRDGVPILINKEEDYYLTKGSLITFREDKKKWAYKIISRSLLRKLYEWDSIKIDGKTVNILFGVNPDNGSSYIEGNERFNFNGKDDPFFAEALKLIERNLNSSKFSWHEEDFFELQMNYMLLWSAIERYSSLKYNKRKKKWNNEKFSEEKAFREGIKRYKDTRHQPVYSTEDLKVHEFNADEPYETLKYYYTLRCNVVHRGKSMHGDYYMLKTATEELLELFKDVLKDTFDYEVKDFNSGKNIKMGVNMDYDFKKLEDNLYELLNKLFYQNYYERDEIKVTEDLLEQQEALFVPFGYLSYFLVIEDEKPVLYVEVATRMGIEHAIGFVDENGDEGYDLTDGGPKDIIEKFKNQLQKVKKFEEIKMPKNKIKEK